MSISSLLISEHSESSCVVTQWFRVRLTETQLIANLQNRFSPSAPTEPGVLLLGRDLRAELNPSAFMSIFTELILQHGEAGQAPEPHIEALKDKAFICADKIDELDLLSVLCRSSVMFCSLSDPENDQKKRTYLGLVQRKDLAAECSTDATSTHYVVTHFKVGQMLTPHSFVCKTEADAKDRLISYVKEEITNLKAAAPLIGASNDDVDAEIKGAIASLAFFTPAELCDMYHSITSQQAYLLYCEASPN